MEMESIRKEIIRHMEKEEVMKQPKGPTERKRYEPEGKKRKENGRLSKQKVRIMGKNNNKTTRRANQKKRICKEKKKWQNGRLSKQKTRDIEEKEIIKQQDEQTRIQRV